jgi:hypothetical protein
MSSNKRKDEIQKSVEESILDAVTRLQQEESSVSQVDGPRPTTANDHMADDIFAQSLWDMAKKTPTKIEDLFAAPPPPQKVAKNIEPQAKENHKIEPDPNILEVKLPEIKKNEAQKPDVGSADGSFAFDSKIFGDPSGSAVAPGDPVKPPVFRAPLPIANAQPIATQNEGSQLHTVAMPVKPLGGKEDGPAFSPPVFNAGPSPLANLNSIQLKLYEGDYLKIAQKRIEDLEADLERLRIENERLASATELFQKRADENLSTKQELEKKVQFNEERFIEERASLKSHLEQRDLTIQELKEKVNELETRLSTDIRKSRSRERELENRLELARLERISLVGSKDEIILDLKRQVDQLNHELGNYRRKVAEMNQTIEANQEQTRRTVRALRLALTNLEVNEQIGARVKKAE